MQSRGRHPRVSGFSYNDPNKAGPMEAHRGMERMKFWILESGSLARASSQGMILGRERLWPSTCYSIGLPVPSYPCERDEGRILENEAGPVPPILEGNYAILRSRWCSFFGPCVAE